MRGASWQSTGKWFFLIGGMPCESFSQKGKKDVQGPEDHHSSINQEGEAEDKATREPFLFIGHISLHSQISTLRKSPSSLLYPLNAEGRHKTQEFLEAFSWFTSPSFPTQLTRVCGTAPKFSVGCSSMQLMHCLRGVCSLPCPQKNKSLCTIKLFWNTSVRMKKKVS